MTPRILKTPLQVEAFKRDWMSDTPLQELTDRYGWSHTNGARHAATRLGLKRCVRRKQPPRDPESPEVLTNGRWSRRGQVMVWRAR